MNHAHEKQTFLELIERGTPVYEACTLASIKKPTLDYWLRVASKLQDETDERYLFLLAYKQARARGQLVQRQRSARRRADPQGPAGDEPRTNVHNPIHLSLFTEGRKQRILQSIRAGGSFDASAQEAGVDPQFAFYWRERGRQDLLERGQADTEFALWYQDLISAMGAAKLSCEQRTHADSPMSWLLFGPNGRQTETQEGWTRTQSHHVTVERQVRVVTSWGNSSGTPGQANGHYRADWPVSGAIVEARPPALPHSLPGPRGASDETD